MPEWTDRIITAEEAGELFQAFRKEWLLLEVLTVGANGKASTFKLIGHGPEKEALKDRMLDEDRYEPDKKYVMIYADPDKVCEL